MKRDDLAKVVLYQMECFWRLQEIDEFLRCDDHLAVALMDRLYSSRRVGWRDLHPLICLHSTLTQIVVPVSFALALSDEQLSGLHIKSEHQLVFRTKGEEIPAGTRPVLRVIRNALAHLPDFASGKVSPNVSFDEGLVRFWTKQSDEVVFKAESGFVEFIQDVFGVVRRACTPGSTTSRINAPKEPTVQPSGDNLKQLLAEGWRLIQEFAPFKAEDVAQLPREVAAIKFWAKTKLHEVEPLSPQDEEWQAAVSMAIETAYRIARMSAAT